MSRKVTDILMCSILSFGVLLSGCGVEDGEVEQSPAPITSTAQPTAVPFDDGKPYKTEKFTCQNGELSISGKIYIPKETDGKLPTVILSHGYNNTMVSMQSYATDLAKNGYVSVCFDFCGGATSSSSDGSTTQMSIFTEKNDLEAVIEAVCLMNYVDTENLYLLGASQGGAVSAMVAAELQEQIRGLVLLYPAFSAADDARNTYGSLDDVPQTLEYMGMEIGRAYYEELFDYDPYNEIGNYTGEVLLMHGTKDSTVAYEYSEKAVGVYPNATLVTFEGAGHGFQAETLDSALEQIRAFLDNNLSH